jgi:hypothetical protein
MNRRKNGLRLTDDPAINEEILQLVAKWKLPEQGDDFAEMIASLYKLSQQSPTSGDMTLFKRSMAELRYAQKVFAPYRNERKICIFGSARIRPPSSVYESAREFARLMTEANFMTITGAGDGVMAAAQEGAGAEKSFGLNILLPFEQHLPARRQRRGGFSRRLRHAGRGAGGAHAHADRQGAADPDGLHRPAGRRFLEELRPLRE